VKWSAGTDICSFSLNICTSTPLCCHTNGLHIRVRLLQVDNAGYTNDWWKWRKGK